MNEILDSFGLSVRDRKTILNIFRQYPGISVVYIFGSRAKGNYKPGSDIDLAIMNEGVSDKTMNKIRSDFEESSLPYTVDLVNFPSLTIPEFIDLIKRVGVKFN